MIKIENLTYFYNSFRALGNISLTIPKSSVTVLLGPNGAGKTTLISLLCGLRKASQGRIEFYDNRNKLNTGSAVKNIGYVAQENIIWENLTCREHLYFTQQLYSKNNPEKIDELLKFFGLSDKKHIPATQLSGGMKRKLNCAMALVHDPDILIFDESESGLDVQSRIQLRTIMQEQVSTYNKTIIYATHDVEEAEKVADAVAIFDHGRLLLINQMCSVRQEYNSKSIICVTLADPGLVNDALKENLNHRAYAWTMQNNTIRVETDNDIKTIIHLLGLFKEKQATIEIKSASLEDLFIHLTGKPLD